MKWLSNIFDITLEDKEYYRQNKAIIWLLWLWIFRFVFLLMGNAGGVALNKYVLFQLGLEGGMMLLAKKRNLSLLRLFHFEGTNGFCILYAFGTLSCLWSVMPAMSFYFAFQNFILLAACILLFSKASSFEQAERWYLFTNVITFSLYLLRSLQWGCITHSVTHGTVAAVFLSYCIGEYKNPNRSQSNLKLLRTSMILGILVLISASSSGAIVSLVFATLTIGLFSNNPKTRRIAFFVLTIGGSLYFLGGVDIIYHILFPNKPMSLIKNGNGRTLLWDLIFEKAKERPWFGWGFGTVERILEEMYVTDAHNSFVGTLGSLGRVGVVFFLYAVVKQLFFIFKNRAIAGFRGILAATVCAFVNSNTSNLLVSKANISSLTYTLILALGVVGVQLHNKYIQHENSFI